MRFSCACLIYPAALFLPNMLWVRDKPAGYETYAVDENKLPCCERTGEVLVCRLFFPDGHLFDDGPVWNWAYWHPFGTPQAGGTAFRGA